MGNFASSDASSVKEAQRVSTTSSTPPVNCCQVPKDSRTRRTHHWDSGSIQDWLETAELVGPRVYSCRHCRNHVCLHDDIISKAFQVPGEEWPRVSLLPRHERHHRGQGGQAAHDRAPHDRRHPLS
ncbi:hypothetical protein ACQJBY_072491 [Aegilops geniculata]